MFYIHHNSCISPQQSFDKADLEILHSAVDHKLLAIEPAYESIPPGMLRRMGKALRMGVGAAAPLLQNPVAGIILGTANGGMEDCVKFLNQIVDYNEGVLTPGNFVQSTPNAIAGQLGLLNKNKGYNITHVHQGMAFENAVIDVDMLLAENPESTYLLGGVDEISSYNYNINCLAGMYKEEVVMGTALYETSSPGSIAGEGAAMFLVNKSQANAIACLQGISILQSDDRAAVKAQLDLFLSKYLPAGEKIDLLLSGESGDNRVIEFYTDCENIIDTDTDIARFKHLTGEFPTASAIALWLGCYIFQHNNVPSHMIKRSSCSRSHYKNILIYNNYTGRQHSYLLITNMQNS